jgi:hypothetical protein
MTILRDPRLDLPDDLDELADLIPPAGPGLSGLRRLIGLLQEPLRSVQPRLANQEDQASSPADPQAAVGSGLGSQTGPSASGMNPGQGSVPGSMIIPGSVSGSQIAADSITATNIAAESITANELAANSVTADEIAANSVSADEIQAGTITAGEIATGTITGLQLEDGTISDVEISGVSANKITAGTITAVTITASNIQCGGGGYDGFDVLGSGGSSVGGWDSVSFYCVPTAQFQQWISVAGAGYFMATGVVTRVVGGAFSNVPPNEEGQLGIDSTNGRFYFRHSSGWHYTAQTAGLEIPEYERMCPACGNEITIDSAVVARITDIKPDGARHGLYVHFDCAKAPLNQALVDAALEQGAAGADGGPPVPPDTEAADAQFQDTKAARADKAHAQAQRVEQEAQFEESKAIVEKELAKEQREEELEALDEQKSRIVKTK